MRKMFRSKATFLLLLALSFFMLLHSSEATVTPDPTEKKEKQSSEETDNNDPAAEEAAISESTDAQKQHNQKVQNFSESLRQSFYHPDAATNVRKQFWRSVFDEIKNFTGSFSYNMTTSFASSLSSSTTTTTTTTTPRRFEGFLSWDRLVQDWKEEIQEYLDTVQAESEDGYSMSNFGRSSKPTTTATTAASATEQQSTINATAPKEEEEEATPMPQVVGQEEETTTTTTTTTTPIKEKVELPVPAPAKPGEDVVPHTNIADKSKRILIVTTASLPWRTGTAVNPLLRAAYLTRGRKQAGGSVTIMLPWLERQVDQVRVYGDNNSFESPAQQEAFLRTWLRESANMKEASEDLIIQWYTAWQNPVENSVYSMGDITALITPSDAIDICILEEPEHLNWYRAPGESWTKKFPHVVGILHTNYFSYVMDQPAALVRAPAMKLLCSWMCRAHCHRVIKLSGTLDKVAPEKELVENVHGVRGTFLDVGKDVAKRIRAGNDPVFSATAQPAVYYIGKLLWSKGLGSLMELLKYAEESAELKVPIDLYGAGPDKDAAEIKAQDLGLEMPFHGPVDHAELAFSHKIFVNPSTSEVLCTTSAEALAMGKFVILPSHPSNDFFAQFPNCLTYTSKEEFVGNLYYALTHSPEPLSAETSYALTWEAATERLEAAACIPQNEADLMEQAIKSKEARVEIALPPLVDGENRQALLNRFRNSRERYRQFRTRLSNEIQRSTVLPRPLRERLVKELDRRLDLDIDEILESPKLRLQLSPAELDKSLLELYDAASESPGGDILRVIGGGGRVGLQNFYMKRQAAKQRKKTVSLGFDLFPALVEEVYTEERELKPTEWVRKALNSSYSKAKKNAQIQNNSSNRIYNAKKPPRMCQERPCVPHSPPLSSWNGFRSPSAMLPRAYSRSSKFSLLI